GAQVAGSGEPLPQVLRRRARELPPFQEGRDVRLRRHDRQAHRVGAEDRPHEGPEGRHRQDGRRARRWRRRVAWWHPGACGATHPVHGNVRAPAAGSAKTSTPNRSRGPALEVAARYPKGSAQETSTRRDGEAQWPTKSSYSRATSTPGSFPRSRPPTPGTSG